MPVPAWLAAAADGDEDSAARSTEVLGGNVRVAHKVEDPFHHTGQHYPTKMRTVRLLGMRFNPIVTCGALLCVCTVVLVASLDKENFFASSKTSKRWITESFSWFFIGAQNSWILFIAYILWRPEYRNLKLGSPDSEPDYNTVTWFVMMFGTAGTGTALIYYGVGEPIYHLTHNRYVSKGYNSYDELSQHAINMSFFHWGVHTWMCYSISGICMGLISQRLGLPMTTRFCYFPILGNITYGLVGDIIDMLSVMTTMFAVCASAGVGAVQINTGLSQLFGIKKSLLTQILLVSAMTLIAGLSAYAGLKRGVRVLSILDFSVMSCILIMVLLADKTSFLLNLFVQSIGYHIQHTTDLSFHTDAFEQLGINVDGKAGPAEWMDSWTMFYWGWWVAWSPFVGMFFAKISRGRTVGELIHASLTGPVIYVLLWFSVFGGAGLRMEREAIRDGCLGQCFTAYGGLPFNSQYCSAGDRQRYELGSLQDIRRNERFLERRPGGCKEIRQLSSRPLDQMWFDVLLRYDNIDTLMIVLSLISMTLSVISTTDSGAIVLNMISCNGEDYKQFSVLQKQLWTLILGCITVVLTLVGRSKAISAMQTIIIALGLPYTLLICVMCVAIKMMMDMELHPDTLQDRTVQEGRYKVLYSNDNGLGFWATSIFHVVHHFDVLLGMDEMGTTQASWQIWVLAWCAPWYIAGDIVYRLWEVESDYSVPTPLLSAKFYSTAQREAQKFMCTLFVAFYVAIILAFTGIAVKNVEIIALTFYLVFVLMVCAMRSSVSKIYNVESHMLSDLMASGFLYPFALTQMHHQMQQPRPESEKFTRQPSFKGATEKATNVVAGMGALKALNKFKAKKSATSQPLTNQASLTQPDAPALPGATDSASGAVPPGSNGTTNADIVFLQLGGQSGTQQVTGPAPESLGHA